MSAGAPIIRVLFAIPELDRGGPDRVLFELLTALDRRRFAPSLMVSRPEGYYLARLPPDIPVEVLGDQGVFRDRYPLGRSIRFIRRTAPDVVFATQRMTFTLGLASLAFPRTTRLILRQANDVSADFAVLVQQSMFKHRIARQIALATLRRADAVVCQSQAMARDLRALLGPKATLRVISNPIDVDRVAREASVGQRVLPGAPALVCVGRLMPQKGYDLLLRAIALVRPRHPDLHLTILGEGPERANLDELVRELELAGVVTFAGYSNQPLPEVRSADLFVMASRYEGFPNAALEALACGTPVVLTDCPGANSEIVRPGLNGRLAAGIDERSMALALERSIAELANYDRASITADCAERYGRERIVRAYEEQFVAVASRDITDRA